MKQWPHDDTGSMNAFYGNPTGIHGQASDAWRAHNLVKVDIPWHAVLAWNTKTPIHTCLFHKAAAPALEAVFQALWNECEHMDSRAQKLGLHLFGGTFNYRMKRGLTSLSIHAWGAAIDINPGAYPLGSIKQQPAVIVEAFKAQGAVYGGDWHTRRDPMHFQFATE